MSHLVRPHSYSQYIRIFVIVNLTSFLVTRSALESYYNSQARKLVASNPEKYKPRQNSSLKSQPSHAHPPPPVSPYLQEPDMAPKRGENTKKAAGNAKKAEVASQKAAAADAAQERDEEGKWSQGSKSNKKAADAAEKKAQQAAAKAERERLLAEEEKDQPSKPKSAGQKKAEKKTNATARGTLSLDQLDDQPTNAKETTINATGIDNALDALSLTTDKNGQAVERHPERRFKAAYKTYEERRLPEVDAENPGLRRNQKIELIRKEFEKSEENPFNQAGNIRYDASKEDIAAEKDRLRKGVEGRLAEK